jgi:serine/threonine-protein kinase
VQANDQTLTPSQVMAEDATAPASGADAATATSRPALPARYQLAGRLGAGGMGEVLLASDQQLGRDVAIKRMLASSPALEARFLREARIQGRLEHPAIVPVHELATDSEGRPFFVMKRLTGTTLSDMLAVEATKYSRQKLLRAFADVCMAVAFAHSRGIVHRDLKPSNIMLGDFGEVYVLDWGIARILAEADDDIASTIQSAGPDATEIGAVIGTLGYMSPEQLRGLPIDGRSDVFALGCILFEIIGGQPLLPRSMEGLEDAFSMIVRRASSRARVKDMAPELIALCIEATQLDPERRLASARTLGERVEQFLDGDRDLAQRKELAAQHAQAARTALAAGDDEEHRATAIKEAGRSIALDPTGSDAIKLVTALMLEPPKIVPAEVEKRLFETADVTGRRRARFVAAFGVGMIAFVPLFLWMGVTNAKLMFALGLAVTANAVYALVIASRKRPASTFELHLGVVLDAIMIAFVARAFSPFLIAPGMAATSVMMLLADPRMKATFVVPTMATAVLTPWVLELTGILSPTITSRSGELALFSPMITVSLPTAAIALALFAVTLITLAGLVARRLTDTVSSSLRSVELQAWHLRNLVH